MHDWHPPTILWPLAAMEYVADTQCAELVAMSQRTHAYEFIAG